MGKQKYYVVWQGYIPGIYLSWADCEKQIKGFAQARYKSFETLTEAEKAFSENSNKHIIINASGTKKVDVKIISAGSSIVLAGKKPLLPSISVDAACSGVPGPMEYQGVDTATGQRLFYQGVYPWATNNIGEFLAIVHGLAYLQLRNSKLPIYSDSNNAITWVRNKKAKSNLERTPTTEQVWQLIERAEQWLKNNEYANAVLKWETKTWGENPADFGRK